MPNLYERFKQLIANPPLQVGTVVAFSAGVARVELPGGGVIKARGEAAVAQKVFVRDDVIEGRAPDLDIVLIEV